MVCRTAIILKGEKTEHSFTSGEMLRDGEQGFGQSADLFPTIMKVSRLI